MHTDDMALFACFGIPLEAGFPTFELVLDVGPIEIDFVDSNGSDKHIKFA